MSYISPRISIVDGTHLCLLPSSGNVLNDSVLGGSSEKNQHQQTHVAIDDMHHINEESINIPAVPLSSICNVYNGGEYISCVLGDDTTAEDIHIGSKPQVSKSTSSADKNNLHKLPIETIQIQTSNISNAKYRFIHSTSIINNDSTNNLPLRIVASDDLDEGIISVNNKHVKVCLPSFTSSDEHLVSPRFGDDEERKVYGGEYYNIGNHDTGNDDMMHGTQSGNKGQQSFEIQGAGSCLVADFLGLVGYEQALVLPQISAELLSKLNSSDDDETIQQEKELLQMILRHSFLTDGTGILLPKSYANSTNLTTIKTDDNYSMLSLIMSPLERLEEDLVDAGESTNDGGSELLTQEVDVSAHHPSNTTKDTQPADMNNNTSPQEDPEWLKLILQTVEHRLSKQVEESNQIERSAQARIDLVNQGRRTLHAASRTMMNHSTEEESVWSNDPEMFRLRYGVRPRSSSSLCGGILVVLDLELDILMPSSNSSAEGTANSPSSATNTIHDFHISCSLTNNNKKNNQTTATTPENIRTSSGVVPTLTSGDCITMLASVCLDDLKISMNDDDNSTLDVSIQGLWVDDNASSSTTNNNHHSTRRGAVLCILRLPIDSLFLSPPISSQQRSGGQWIQHEIDFTSNANRHHYPEPSVIVDYRQPRTLTIDTSNEMNSTNAKMWKDLVSNLNASISGGGLYIDLYCKKDSPRLKLVIFSSNSEERVGKCLFCLLQAEFVETLTYLFIFNHIYSICQARST